MHVGGPSNTRFGQKYHYTASTTEVEDPDSLMHTLEARSGFKADVKPFNRLSFCQTDSSFNIVSRF